MPRPAVFLAAVTERRQGVIGSYVTKPGTPLGEGERINMLRPSVPGIGIHFQNASALQTIDVSEVRLFRRLGEHFGGWGREDRECKRVSIDIREKGTRWLPGGGGLRFWC